MKNINESENQENNVSARFAYLRKVMGITQTKMGFELGIASNYVWAIENNRRKPGLTLCKKIVELSKKYGIKVDLKYLRPDIYEE